MGNIVIKLQYMEQTYQTYQYLDQLRFCMAMLMAMMLKDNAFAMIATVCSSWVFVSRSVMLGWMKYSVTSSWLLKMDITL